MAFFSDRNKSNTFIVRHVSQKVTLLEIKFAKTEILDKLIPIVLCKLRKTKDKFFECCY